MIPRSLGAVLSPIGRFALWIVLLLAMLATGLVQWQQGAHIQTDILAMLPHLQQDKLTETALNKVEQQLANQVYIAINANNDSQAISAAKQLMISLEQQTQQPFTAIRSGADDHLQDLAKVYFEHRFGLLTPEQAHAIETGHWRQLLNAAQSQLYSAFGFANSQLLSNDPLLMFPANLLALSPNSALRSQQGVLLTDTVDGVAAIVMAKGRDSAFSPTAQQQQMQALESAFSQINQHYPEVSFLKAGALFHAIAATESAKQEISRIGLISMLGIILLVWLAFRSMMPLFAALLTLTSGVVFAFVATLSFFGELHLLTLVFGTSLIGVAIDYSFHFYCEKQAHPNDNASDTLKRIFPALTLALVTSVSAFVAIGFTPFPGMQQVAVFCAAGLMGAYLTLLLVFPLLGNYGLKPTRGLTLAQGYLTVLQRTFIPSRLWQKVAIAALLIGLTAILFLGLSQADTDDDIRQLQQSPAAITSEENQLRQLLSGGTDNQFILVSGHNEQALLQTLEQLVPVLDKAVADGELSQAISLSRFMPSIARQRHDYQLQQQLYQQHLDEIITEMGLNDSIKTSLLAQLDQATTQWLTPKRVLAQANDDLHALWLGAISTTDNTEQYGAIVLLGGIHSLVSLEQRLTDQNWSLGQVRLIDKVGGISALMGKYRQLTLQLLVWVFVLASLLFSIKYGIKLALAIVAVPALSVLLTLACLGLVGSSISLFHALALILVLGIGIDYSLFFAEAKHTSRGVMMAIFMSACSTLLAFGLLALSQTNAIHFFGLTLLFGISFAFLLAPFISFITRKTL
ncbi:MMPL family transporter [Shewanella psychromarinicola]|uniref:Transporter permease n=1 Tax=Shewanella psychromarinicola TaxID=2487742 RepID=A0A3N4EB02_9GAMM|nr:MMPL family transporter [Shewanella psychromarinicola]AZG33942.1 transporter permease [Shewanella psychromarinicola]MCL1080929.1 MMPL family transporter [Shewanella psychromarinicola]RPA31420.1 transporter permease [Shewanella psychromarinicola]